MSGGHMTPCSTCKHRTRDWGRLEDTCMKSKKVTRTYDPVHGPQRHVHIDTTTRARMSCKGTDHEPTFWQALKDWLRALVNGSSAPL